MLDTVTRDAQSALTQGQQCLQGITTEDELVGLRTTLDIRVKALSLWLGAKAKGMRDI